MRARCPSWIVLVLSFAATAAFAHSARLATELAPGQTCIVITQASADASAGVANINHDGTALPGKPAPDISLGFKGIPRSTPDGKKNQTAQR